MGPMGPMMGGGGGAGGDPTLLALLLVVVLAAGAGLVALILWRDRDLAGGRRPTPEEGLRLRYSRGELSREQYRQALVDILKDRYVRGELDVETYEASLDRLLEEPRALPRAADGGSAPR